ncbi:hypothetical protein [Flavobacterium macacae]|uniref:Uncharacterized protein n=1 Tax=Flavobacterium macacae TaxID=2488993 RepID=A0A3P3W2D5_9FLAO|nr:hypothetical protein [Flavobacterium macacae]RRJ89252.1 hypothetical protein EG849_13360 [Flavobacterium macacae]
MENENAKRNEKQPDINADNATAKDLKSNGDIKAVPAEGEDNDDYQNDNTDKYLAMEQPGVQYTKENDFSLESDKGGRTNSNKFDENGGNSRNSDAFSQDDYLLEDNLDLDEDQNKSISTDDEDYEELNEN